jgi:NAD(P)-dependent dehydrogenase (short-subunit alcohol dehydrogenase family)
MSAEMTPFGIRVNCVHPGLIETDMTQVMNDENVLPMVLAQISMGRAASHEIGTVVAFASDEASYLTGQSIHVDGGWKEEQHAYRALHASVRVCARSVVAIPRELLNVCKGTPFPWP